MIASVERLFTVPTQWDPLGVQRRSAEPKRDAGADLGAVIALLQELLRVQREFRLELAEVRKQIENQDGKLADLEGGLAAWPTRCRSGDEVGAGNSDCQA
jgi:hypothetical protein